MLRKMMFSIVAIGFASGGIMIAGCSESKSDAALASTPSRTRPVGVSLPAKSGDQATLQDEEHAHKPGAHGGIIVPIGRDSFHAEAVLEKDGVLRLYTLGQDEGRVHEVENQQLKGYVKISGGSESTPFVLKPQPQEGDTPGKTSHFVANLPEEFWGHGPASAEASGLRGGPEPRGLCVLSTLQRED